MKKFEILWELPKCEQMQLVKWRDGHSVATNLPFVKKKKKKKQYLWSTIKQGMPMLQV